MLHTLLFCTVCSPLLRQGLFFLRKCVTSSCSQTWSLCGIGCKNLAAISDIRHLRELWYWVVALPCGVHMWSTCEAWTRWCFKEMQSERLWQHWMESWRVCSMEEKKMFSGNTSVNLLLYVMLIANNSLGLKLFGNSLFDAIFSTWFLQTVSLTFFSFALCFMMSVVFVKSFQAMLLVT